MKLKGYIVSALLLVPTSIGIAACVGADPAKNNEADESAAIEEAEPGVDAQDDRCGFTWEHGQCETHRRRVCRYFCGRIVVPHDCHTERC